MNIKLVEDNKELCMYFSKVLPNVNEIVVLEGKKFRVLERVYSISKFTNNYVGDTVTLNVIEVE